MVKALSLAVAALTVASSIVASTPQLSVKVVSPSRQSSSSSDSISNHVLALQKVKHPSRSSGYLRALGQGPDSADKFGWGPHSGETHINDLFSEEYIATIEWNKKSVQVIVDSGSSDTWLVQSGFQCLNINGTNVTESECVFGPPFEGTFQSGKIADENFNITYGDLEFLSGDFGYEDVTVAGITAKNQQVALVNRAYWTGDGVTSGLMGLAYPLLTSAFKGDDSTNDSLATQVVYNPIFTTMVNEKQVNPVFSLACERNSSSGYLALGGLPPVRVSSPFASTPIRKLEVYNETEMLTHYSFYTIVADAYIYQGSGTPGGGVGGWWNRLVSWPGISFDQFPIIVDSGTTLLYLPSKMTSDIIAGFHPPAVYVPDQGAYFAPCNAEVPKLSVLIGGYPFSISSADMLVQGQTLPNDTNSCLVGLADGGEGPYILGDTFLNNVVAVFDVGASEMRFAEHHY